MAYQSVSVDDRNDDDREAGTRLPDAAHRLPIAADRRRRVPLGVSCLGVAALILIACDLARRTTLRRGVDRGNEGSPRPGVASSSLPTGVDIAAAKLVSLPTGVNIASWLSLEDWFFVGTNGAVEVASPDDATAAACLPPLHLDASTGPRWNSETDLLAGLAEHYRQEEEASDGGGQTLGGYPNAREKSLGGWGKAIRAVHAFRSSYFDMDSELRTMAELGIKYVRVPVSWCFTDHDPAKLVAKNETHGADEDGNGLVYMNDDEVMDKYTCQDPFYEDVRWPAIPRNFVQRFLRACAKHGIGATLDIHTYPGGTSIGTFSGVWPRYSRFWTHGDLPATDDDRRPDVGRTLLKDFIGWMESLEVEDPEAFRGLRAISPMNEPAHLAGLYNGERPVRTDRETFLPPLPPDMARKYLAELNEGLESHPQLTRVSDGNHLRVFLWLRDAVDAFRQSKLPSLGKELHVNVHESVFPADVLPEEEGAPDYGLGTGAMRLFGAWWRATATAEERSKWAVLDLHHYMAWGGACSGAVEGFPAGRYACSDEEAKARVIGGCSAWSKVYRSTLEGECGEGLRLASAEFSASTHHSVRHACNDPPTLKMMLESQVDVARDADVELFWWSYRMPYGGAFRGAWSLKHLLHLLGVLPRPDEEIFHCGDHVPPPGEPMDGTT